MVLGVVASHWFTDVVVDGVTAILYWMSLGAHAQSDPLMADVVSVLIHGA